MAMMDYQLTSEWTKWISLEGADDPISSLASVVMCRRLLGGSRARGEESSTGRRSSERDGGDAGGGG